MGNSHKQANSTGIVARRVFENRQQRSRRGVDDGINVSSDEEEDNQEDRAGNDTNNNAADHDPGSDDGRVGDFWEC